jgi:hypothetical protein
MNCLAALDRTESSQRRQKRSANGGSGSEAVGRDWPLTAKTGHRLGLSGRGSIAALSLINEVIR